MARLAWIVPLTIALIFILLYTAFGSLRHAGLILANIPFATVGGVLALFVSGQYLSVPAAVGFIAVFGVAVLNGIVLIKFFNSLRAEGKPLKAGKPTVACPVRGCRALLSPIGVNDHVRDCHPDHQQNAAQGGGSHG